MAVNRDKLFDGIANGASWDAGVVFNRTNGIPIEKWSVFKTIEDAKAYASTNPVAYPGQLIAVVPESGRPIPYIINGDGTISEIAGSGISFTVDETLTLENSVLSVNTTDTIEGDNTLPITSAAVNTVVGNIDILLQTI